MLIFAILLLLIILAMLLWIIFELRAAGWGKPNPAPPPPPAPAIPDSLTPATLATLLQTRLAGTPADGTPADGPANPSTPSAVIWVDQGDEVLVHLDSLEISFAGSVVLVAIDLETDQSGRTPMVVALALGDQPKAGGALLAATDEIPRGNALLAARWGKMLRDAAWNAFLALAADHADQTRQAPLALTLANDQLHLTAGPAIKLG